MTGHRSTNMGIIISKLYSFYRSFFYSNSITELYRSPSSVDTLESPLGHRVIDDDQSIQSNDEKNREILILENDFTKMYQGGVLSRQETIEIQSKDQNFFQITQKQVITYQSCCTDSITKWKAILSYTMHENNPNELLLNHIPKNCVSECIRNVLSEKHEGTKEKVEHFERLVLPLHHRFKGTYNVIMLFLMSEPGSS